MSSDPRPAADELFAIGDVHGCADELAELIDQLPLRSTSTVVFLGDYIDRGEKSREVVDHILALRERCRVVTLKGNHEQMLQEFLAAPTSWLGARFVLNGGSATLASYGNEIGEYDFPRDHQEFFNELEFFHQTTNHFFVHAGVPDVQLERIEPREHWHDLLWIRAPFLRSAFPWSKTIVHGHTWVDDVEIRPRRINLDTGCVYQGRLSAMGFPSGAIYSVSRRMPTTAVHLRNRQSRRRAVRFDGQVPMRIEREGAGEIPLETLNYSALGLYAWVREQAEAGLAIGDRIEGVIGSDPEASVRFVGRIIRRDQRMGKVYYAISLEGTQSSLSEPAPRTDDTSKPATD